MGVASQTGTVTPGKAAGFVIIDQDLYSVDPHDIHHTAVEYAHFAGRRVYERAEAIR